MKITPQRIIVCCAAAIGILSFVNGFKDQSNLQPVSIAGNGSEPFDLPIGEDWYDKILELLVVS